jgi:hypothetical protein
MVRIVSLFAVAWLVLVAGVAAAEPPSPDAAAGVGNDILGVVPTQAAAHSQAGGGAKAGSNLTYHGGKVLLTNKTVAIYWSPSNAIGSGSSYSSLINQYFGDVAAASGTTGNVYAVETQYYNSTNAHIAYSSTFTGAVYDSQPYPANGCSDSVSQTTTCLSDAQLRAEIQRLYSSGAIQADSNTTYFVFTDKNIGSCYSSSSCAFSQYCAYHSNVALGSTTVQYANQPYADTVTSACDSGYRPNNNDADATINVTSHEHRESINDPLGNAWYDRRGYEGSDKCAWDFGTVAADRANQTINGHRYILQQEWSNAGSACALTG